MPNRILRDYRDSATMSKLTDFQERLFVRMIMTADDFGRGLANNLHATCFQVVDVSKATCLQAAIELRDAGLIRLYTDKEGRNYYDIPKFGNTPRAKYSKCPSYDECKQIASNLHADCKQDARLNREPKTENREPRTDSCAEPEIPASTPPPSPVVLTFDNCTGAQKTWELTQAQVDAWAELFPALDILAECRQAKAWEDANPANRKTANGHTRFLFNWLTKSQNSGRGRFVSMPLEEKPKHVRPSDAEIERMTEESAREAHQMLMRNTAEIVANAAKMRAANAAR